MDAWLFLEPEHEQLMVSCLLWSAKTGVCTRLPLTYESTVVKNEEWMMLFDNAIDLATLYYYVCSLRNYLYVPLGNLAVEST